MSGLAYYVIDTETTGLKPDWHEITQISIIRFEDRHQISKFIRARYPKRANPEALRITGKTEADLRIGEDRVTAVEAIDKFIRSDGLTDEHRCMIAHNAPFDKNFCHALWKSVGKVFPAICWADSKTLAKTWAVKLGIEKPKLSLAAALEFTGIVPVPGQHNAISDSRNTYLLWKKGVESGVDYFPAIKRYPQVQEDQDLSLQDLIGNTE